MLAVQVSYMDLLEKERHNQATERLSRDSLNEEIRSHYANEELGKRTLSETKRHNIVTEGETQRHNIAGERLSQQSLYETQRHNLATENLTGQQIAVSRDNIALGYANLQEQERHNLAQEHIQTLANDISGYNALTNRQNAETNERNANTNAFKAEVDQQAQALKEREYNETSWSKGAIRDQEGAQSARDIMSYVNIFGRTLDSIIPVFNWH